jgi:hypothetical protein
MTPLSRRVQSLLRLQRQYGNTYVQRVLSVLRKTEGDAIVSAALERAVQRGHNGGKDADRAVNRFLPTRPAPAGKASGQAGVQREAEEEEEESVMSKSAALQLQEQTEEEEEPIMAKSAALQLQAQTDEEKAPACTEPGCIGTKSAARFATADKIQTKLTLGAPGDMYEEEADRVAEQVSTFVNSRALNGINAKMAAGVDVPKVFGLIGVPQNPISRTSHGMRGMRIFPDSVAGSAESRTVDESIEARIMQGRGRGQALPAGVTNAVALQTGYDFGNVRVKTDSEAAMLSKSLNARAFTLGSDIWLAENESVNDVKLMAHELTHVVQQGAAQRISPQTVAGFDSMRSTNKVLTYLRALTNGKVRDPSTYARQIERFQTDNPPETIAGLQRQILEKPKDGKDSKVRQKSDSQTIRACSRPSRTTAPSCPTQTVTMSGARCGAQYGAVGRYCYSGARNWWFKENVTLGTPNTCVPGATITQTTTPIQARGNCVSDQIFNFNGPPANVAPCTIVTNQTVYTGPTRSTVTQCQYNNRQVIRVTVTPGSSPRAGKVITSSAGVSTDCNWP